MDYSNLKKFALSIINFESDLAKLQAYIKENFNTESEFEDETDTLFIWNENINESVQLVAAKEYIANNFGLDRIQIAYGKKEKQD